MSRVEGSWSEGTIHSNIRATDILREDASVNTGEHVVSRIL